jgi:hypothetical protein
MDDLPRWPLGHAVDCETAVEITMLLLPVVDWEEVEDGREVSSYVMEVVRAFCRAHADTDWDATDYADTLNTFVRAHVREDAPHWLGNP